MKTKSHRLAITTDDNGSSIVHDAIDHHRAISGESGRRTMASDGRALVAICAEWMDVAGDRIKAAKGGRP